MRKKCRILALWSFIIAIAIFVFTYFLFHYLGPCGKFTSAYQVTPVKPVVTMLFGVWGVTFLFGGVMSLLVGRIFFPQETAREPQNAYAAERTE